MKMRPSSVCNSTSRSIQLESVAFNVGQKTGAGIWGCPNCNVGDHFDSKLICTNCVQSVNPSIIQQDESNKENLLRRSIQRLDVDRLRKNYPDQAKKVEQLKVILRKKEQETLALSRSLQSKYSQNLQTSLQPQPQFAPTTGLLNYPMNTPSDVTHGYNSAPKYNSTGAAPMSHLQFPNTTSKDFTVSRNSGTERELIYTPRTDTSLAASPKESLAVAQSNSIATGDNDSISHIRRGNDNSLLSTTTMSLGNTLQTVNESPPSSETAIWKDYTSEYQSFSSKYGADMSIFQLIKQYTTVSSAVLQHENEIKSKILSLGITEQCFRDHYSSLTKSFICQGFPPLWRLIICSQSFDQFKNDLLRTIPELYNAGERYVTAQAEAVEKNLRQADGAKKETLPLGSPPNYDPVSYENLPLLVAHILLRQGDNFLSKRAKKTLQEKINRTFNKLIHAIYFETKRKEGAKEKPNENLENIASSSNSSPKSDNDGSQGVNVRQSDDLTADQLINRETLRNVEVESLSGGEDGLSDFNSDSSNDGNVTDYDQLFNLASTIQLGLGNVEVLSVQSPAISLRFTKASFNSLVGNHSIDNPGPNIIICMIGLLDILYDILLAVSIQAMALKNLTAMVLLVPSAVNGKLIGKFISSFQRGLELLSKKTVYSKLVDLKYGDIDKRKAVVITAYEPGYQDISSEVEATLVAAKERCAKIYGKESEATISGGVHSTRTSAVKAILKFLVPARIEQQVIWEIGVGYPKFAFILSAISKQCVLCNDLESVINELVMPIKTIREMSGVTTNATSLATTGIDTISGTKRPRNIFDEESLATKNSFTSSQRNRVRYDDEDD